MESSLQQIKVFKRIILYFALSYFIHKLWWNQPFIIIKNMEIID